MKTKKTAQVNVLLMQAESLEREAALLRRIANLEGQLAVHRSQKARTSRRNRAGQRLSTGSYDN